MDYEKDSSIVMEDIEKILGEMVDEKVPVRRAMATSSRYISPGTAQANAILLKVYFVEEDGERKYFVEECALYALGDSLYTRDPNSTTLIPCQMPYLDTLIQKYEQNNPGVKVEKHFVQHDMFKNYNMTVTSELIDNYTNRLERYLESNEKDSLTLEDVDKLIDVYYSEIDLDYIKQQVFENLIKDKYLEGNGNSFKQ